MTKKGFLALLSLAVTLNAGAQTTLDQAVQEALTKGADQETWAAGLAGSQASEAAARARAGLTLSSSLGYSATQTQSDPARTSDSVVPHTASAGLTLAAGPSSLTLRANRKMNLESDPAVLSDGGSANLNIVLWNGYPGGATQASADKAALALKVAQWNSQSSRNKLIVNVKQAYFTLLSAQEALNQLTQTQKQRAEASKFAETKFSLGQATALDLKQAKINARTADLDLSAGRSTLETARRRLANLMGRPDTDPLTVATEPDPTVAVETLDQAVELALRQRVEPLVAQANARSAQIDADAAFGSATPSVSLTGTLNLSKNAAATSPLAYDGTVGVSIGAPLWDAGLSSAQQAQAQAQKTTAQIQYQQLPVTELGREC